MLEFSSWRDDDCVMKVEGLRRKSEKKKSRGKHRTYTLDKKTRENTRVSH